MGSQRVGHDWATFTVTFWQSQDPPPILKDLWLFLTLLHSPFTWIQPQFSSVQSLSCVWLFATPWIPARQASLSITNFRRPPKPISNESVMTSNHLIFCRPLLLLPQSFPASGSFQMSQFFTSGGQTIGVSASTSVLPMNTQYWSLLGWTGCISLQSKGLSRVFSNTTVQKHQSLALSFLYSPTLTSVHDCWKNRSFD